MSTPANERTGSWRFTHEPPPFTWDEQTILGGAEFDDSARAPGRRVISALLVGHSRDPDLARVAGQLGSAGAAVDVLLVDRIGCLPSLEFPAPQKRHYDVAYCRGIHPDQFVHYHFDRTLRRAADWQDIGPTRTPHVAGQAACLLWGWLAELEIGRWVNSPWRLRDAENKLTQLAAAQHAGMPVPATLVTTSLSQAKRFSAQFPQGVIHKSLASPIVQTLDGGAQFLYTAPVSVDQLAQLDHPTLFQERLEPVAEHRVTMVGRRVFTASLARSPGDQTDWRRSAGEHQRFEHGQLPSAMTEQIRALMSELHIEIGAADIVETPTGFYFLEINPSAALLWLERSLGMQLSQSVTTLLLCGA